MRDETYDYIWNEIILDNINDLFGQYSDEEKIRFGIRVKSPSEEKQVIYDRYMFENRRIKELYHYGTDAEKLIDMHKVAACFTKVFMEEQLFQYSLKEKLLDNILLSNAYLAYNVGIDLIRMNLIVSYLKLGRQDIVDKLMSEKHLRTPKTNEGHDEYNAGRQKTLMLNEVFENEFDILTYSDMLFWIEYYNRQLLEDNIQPQALPIIDLSD